MKATLIKSGLVLAAALVLLVLHHEDEALTASLVGVASGVVDEVMEAIHAKR